MIFITNDLSRFYAGKINEAGSRTLAGEGELKFAFAINDDNKVEEEGKTAAA